MAITHAAEIMPPVPLRERGEAELILLWLHRYPELTRKTYASTLRSFQDHLQGRALRSVTIADLEAYAASIGDLAPSTRRNRLSSIASLFGFLTKAGHLAEDPATLLRLPKVGGSDDPGNFTERQVPERDHIRAMVDAEPNERNRLLIRFAYLTGARNAELRGLTVAALRERPDMAGEGIGGQATLRGKGNKLRVVLIRRELWRDLRAWIEANALEADSPVFPGRAGKPMDGATAWRIVTAAADRVGVKAHVHDIRHAHATDALDGGAQLKTAQQSLGHASPNTTAIYLHRRPKEGTALFVDL
ncbi:tyrosine-type recombinase/integrase [Thalassobaculum litoreum]|uniref:Integrase/recombinase XerD n=1 Tax=Thalassobaculum litoreum DSM 18839 TaxID=1123362 RepID=A0A8G2EWH9_9PROT|nr:tyrosine-type recombinase/integrase [Thalassobaculum litoreum]SDF83019.1 integrase/recombinase XerD [Thalassobaculum litoreum DSM 18839]